MLRITLKPDHTEFVKQVAEVRRHLNGLQTRGGREGRSTPVPRQAAPCSTCAACSQSLSEA